MRFSFGLTARDREEKHRTESKLELFFDLTLVVAFGTAASQFAHYAVEGYIIQSLAAFIFTIIGLAWGWSSYAWFSSAYEKDDSLFRFLTMIQMVGVVILTLGIPAVFESINSGEHINNTLAIVGYVIMRIPIIIQWMRVAYGDKSYKKTAILHIKYNLISQVLWVISVFLPISSYGYNILVVFLMSCEVFARTFLDIKYPMPWQGEHIADRYGSLTIIALGEIIFGTVAALRSLMEDGEGLTFQMIVLGLAGVGIAFSLWKLYFSIPAGKLLEFAPKKNVLWGQLHIFVFAAIVAVGAGMEMTGLYLEHHSSLSTTKTMFMTVAAIWTFNVLLVIMYRYLVGIRGKRGSLSMLVFLVPLMLVVFITSQGISMTTSTFLLFTVMFGNLVYYEFYVKDRLTATLNKFTKEA